MLKEFPFQKMITACTEKLSIKIKSQVLKESKEEMLKHIDRIKDYEKDIILRQSTLFAKIGLLDSRVSKLDEKLKELENQGVIDV